MSRTLSVSAIKDGTVIDHIPPAQAIRIIHLLGFLEKKHRVTVGLNLISDRLKFKDLIKVENYLLTKEEANKITIFAPDATINIIKNFDVVDKIITQLPESISNVFLCPNPNCITHAEPIESMFYINETGSGIHLLCKYCEKTFDRNRVTMKI